MYNVIPLYCIWDTLFMNEDVPECQDMFAISVNNILFPIKESVWLAR